MTLLAAIIVGGLVVSVFAVVSSGIRSSGRDRDFAQSIQIADAGLQQAAVQVERLLIDGEVPDCDPPGWFEGVNDATSGACAGTLGTESDFDWTYTARPEGGYEILSVGRFRGSARAVRTSMTTEIETSIGLIAVNDNDFAGGGGGSGSEPFVMGTYGCIKIPASVWNAGELAGFVYLGDDPEGDRDCWIPGGLAAPVERGGAFLGVRPRPLPAVDVGDAACAAAGMPPAADLPAVLTDTNSFPLDAEDPGAGVGVCVRRAFFPQSFSFETFAAGRGRVTIYVVPDAPATAVVVQAGRFGNNRFAENVNAGADTDPGALRLVVDSGRVEFGRSHDVAMVLDAPRSVCWSHTQGTFSGTVLCQTVDLRGSYTYRPPADPLEAETFRLLSWTEEPVPPGRR